MTKRGHKICIICGTHYEYCPNCGKGKPEDTWKNLYDSLDCKEVFRICSDFVNKRITAAKAKERLDKFNLKDLSNYAEGIRNDIKAIYAEASKEAAPAKKAEVKEEKAENKKKDKTTESVNADKN